MERHEAWQLYIETREKVRDALLKVDDVDSTWSMVVIALDTAIALLYPAVHALGIDANYEAFEDIHTDLGDCLAHVCMARYRCKGRGVRVQILCRVRDDVLRALEDLERACDFATPY